MNTTRALCLGILAQTKVGTLEISDSNGQTHVFGEGKERRGPLVSLKIHRDTFWVRLALFADMVRSNWVNIKLRKTNGMKGICGELPLG